MQFPTRLLGLLCAFALLNAQDPPKNALLVLSKGEHMLEMVDAATGTVLARMPSGPDPHEVIASADGRLAYISNYGGGAYNTITVADLIARKTLPVIDLGALHGPHGLVFTGGKLWFTVEGSKAIGRFDPATQKIDWIMGTGQDRTHMLYVTGDLKKIYTTNISSATVTLMEQKMSGPGGPPPGGPPNGHPAGARGPGGPGGPGGPPPGPHLDWEETLVPVGKGAEGFDVSPDGKELWAANAGDGTISIIDISAQKVTQTLSADVGGANRLKFTLDGKHVLVSSLRGSDLVILDAASRQVIKRLPIGNGAAGIQMEPGGKLAYVACTPDDYVAVIDLDALKVKGHLNAGKEPDGMAWVSQP
jgi:YVTN family beta-propeller protein